MILLSRGSELSTPDGEHIEVIAQYPDGEGGTVVEVDHTTPEGQGFVTRRRTLHIHALAELLEDGDFTPVEE